MTKKDRIQPLTAAQIGILNEETEEAREMADSDPYTVDDLKDIAIAYAIQQSQEPNTSKVETVARPDIDALVAEARDPGSNDGIACYRSLPLRLADALEAIQAERNEATQCALNFAAELSTTEDQLETTLANVEDLKLQIWNVRVIHRKKSAEDMGDEDMCATCYCEWPCKTIRALELKKVNSR